MNDKVDGTYTSANGKALRYGNTTTSVYIVLKIGVNKKNTRRN